MGTVVISSTTYTIYGTEAEALEYLTASLSEEAEDYVDAAATMKRKALVNATRFLESQTWAGARTDASQALAFPRTGIVDRDGTAVDESTIPQDVINAAYELAAILLADPTLSNRTHDLNTKKLVAGTASITYFRPVPGGPFPLSVQRLVQSYLGGTTNELALSIGSGLEEESSFDVADRFDVSNGGL